MTKSDPYQLGKGVFDSMILYMGLDYGSVLYRVWYLTIMRP